MKTRKKKLSDVIATILVIGLLVLGVFKAFEIGKDLITPQPTKVREISISEVAYIENSETEMKAEVKYYSDYMIDFKAIDIPLNKDEQEFLYLISKDYGISYPFILALIDTESGFNKEAISTTEDYGLMQINRVNHNWLKETLQVKNLLDANDNIRCGALILQNLFSKYSTEEEVLMAYNMGQSGAKKLWDKGVYNTNYSDKVLETKKKYEDMLL